MAVSALYAAFLAALLIVLSARVIATRRADGPSLGHGDDPLFERKIRAHGNLIEYAPIGLICLIVLEQGGTSPVLLHLLGLALLVGRTMHALALSFSIGGAIGRVGGMVLTLTMLGVSAALCFVTFLIS